MKAAAYWYADGGPASQEIRLLNYIDRFGVEAVMGRRQLGAGEIRRMLIAENIVTAYNARAKNENWAEWTERNKGLSRLLNESMKLAQEMEDGAG